MGPVFAELANTTFSGNDESLLHAIHSRNHAPNETTFYFVFEFLVTGWIWRMTNLRYVLNAQWKVNPLESIIEATPLTTPKPNITVGYDLFSLTGGSSIPPVVAHSAPVLCDPNLQFPCVTIEVKPFETLQWVNQSLNSAALMLRQLRSLWETCMETRLASMTRSE